MTAEQTRFEVVTQEDVPASMRDGVFLRADIYRPDTDGLFPALLLRTPYGKRASWRIETATDLASRGYVVILQDVRGRGASDGKFFWNFGGKHNEAEDGYDSVEWAATLPYSTGKVGTYGASYNGQLQWELATLRPPHLVAMAPVAISPQLLDLNFGIFETGRRLRWIHYVATDCRRRDGVSGPQTKDEAVKLWDHMEREKWVWFLPLDDIPADDIFYGLADQYREYLRHQNVEYWDMLNRFNQVETPALGITGWYDRLNGVIDSYVGMVQNGRTEHARQNQKLLVGPWSHTTDLEPQVGEMNFGPAAQLNYNNLLVRWFDYWLKGIDNGVMDEPDINLFIMGENTWRSENEWPLVRTVYTDYYFHSGGAANTPTGDGKLTLLAPGDEPVDSYIYDPRDPVMSLCTPNVQDAPYDQRPLDHRHDVLVYATEPLEKGIEVTGPVTVKLWASSSAPDTDFTAKLVDVYPDGYAVNICHGIIRARYRESYESPTFLEPEEVYEYTIKLRPTSHLFKEGHRIRIDISSSNFPFFDRNHNTDREFYEDAELIKADQTIYHMADCPSRVILPVIPR